MSSILANNHISRKNNLSLPILIAVLLHMVIIAILLCGSLFSERAISVDGDNSIKAVMIDLSVMAAPEQSLVENTPQIDEIEETPIIEEQKVEITPDEPLEKPEVIPDLVVEKEVIEKLQPAKDPQIVVKEKPIKPEDKPKNKPPVKQSSKPQIKQEVVTEKLATTAVAPSISDNSKFSATPAPISRNYPEYPRRALDLRIEGYVIAMYDVSSQGRVENIRIVEAKPNNIFNRAVMQAMKQWKYQPVTAKDLTIKIIFNRNKSIKLENS